MQYEVQVNGGQRRQVHVSRREGRFIVAIGDREWRVDAALIGRQTLSLLIDDASAVLSREAWIAADSTADRFVVSVGASPLPVELNGRRRRGGGPDASSGRAGPQRIVAPMPGKVVRLLAAIGDAVRVRQPVVVVEAMKMENELRAAADGIVTDLLVREGQSVDAGTPLAVITPARP